MNVILEQSVSRPPTAETPALEKAALVFSSLSNTIRLGVLLRLIEREWSVNEMASDLRISQSALSQHLGKLRQAGVVRSRRDKQTVFYHCDDGSVIRLLTEVVRPEQPENSFVFRDSQGD